MLYSVFNGSERIFFSGGSAGSGGNVWSVCTSRDCIFFGGAVGSGDATEDRGEASTVMGDLCEERRSGILYREMAVSVSSQSGRPPCPRGFGVGGGTGVSGHSTNSGEEILMLPISGWCCEQK